MTGDNLMPELHLKQPGFTYNDCGPFNKHRERIQTFRETANLKKLYGNELDKAVLLMIKNILTVKIYQKELFQVRI